MIDTPEIRESPRVLIASIPLRVAAAEMQQVMGPALGELRTAVRGQGIAVTGRWFTHHFQRPAGMFDFEVCLPVARAVRAAGRVQPGELAAAMVARTVYHGSYEGLGAAWGELRKWMAAQGHTPRTDLWEAYLAGAEASADPADWRTELNQPLE